MKNGLTTVYSSLSSCQLHTIKKSQDSRKYSFISKPNKCSKNIYLNSATLLLGFEALGRHCFCLLMHWRTETQCWIYMYKLSCLGLLWDCPLVPICILNRSSPSTKAILLQVSAQAPSCSMFFCTPTSSFSFPLPWPLLFPRGNIAKLIAM